jgi:hypothetical protein
MAQLSNFLDDRITIWIPIPHCPNTGTPPEAFTWNQILLSLVLNQLDAQPVAQFLQASLHKVGTDHLRSVAIDTQFLEIARFQFLEIDCVENAKRKFRDARSLPDRLAYGFEHLNPGCHNDLPPLSRDSARAADNAAKLARKLGVRKAIRSNNIIADASATDEWRRT